MKKFVMKISIFFALIVCSIGILNFLYINTNFWKRNNPIEEIQKFKNVPQYIQLANVGSSHGTFSFDYANVPYQCFNFAMNSQYYLYDYEVLKQYISHFDKNAVLLIPISYFQITYLKSDFTDQKDRYNQFLVKEMGNDYSTQNKLLDYIPVLTANTNLTFIIRDISPASFLTESELLTYSEMKHESWSSMDENDNATTEEGFIHNKQMLSQIIDFCYANDIQPVLITTPITSILNTTYEENSTDFFDTFYRFSRELQEDYPSLLYLDYSHDPRFENEFTLFQDADHLNSVGAKNFTETVIHDLQSNGILTPIN